MKKQSKFLSMLLALCLVLSIATVPAFASSFTDAHGNVIELDDTLEAYTSAKLYGANDAARGAETNLGDLWTDALRWFAVSGKINGYFDEDDVAAGNSSIAVDADHIVALWNGGNIRADIESGKFGAAELAAVLPYPNKVAVVYMTGAQLEEALEAASQGLPYTAASADACASFMQVSGLKYTVDAYKAYDAGEAYGNSWFKAESLSRVAITEVNGKALDKSAVYAVITSNANYNGMDSSYIFKDAVAADSRSAITTAVVRDIVWMYIDEALENMVGDTYADAQGRITVNGVSFTDTNKNAWYMDAISYVVSHGLMSGTSATTFTPSGTMTRAMAVSVLYRMAGSPDVEYTGTTYYAAARQWAINEGIYDGSNITGNITRQELALMLYLSTEGAEPDGDLSEFSDAGSIADSALDAMKWAVGNGIIQGSSGMLRPAGTASRAEVARIFMLYFSK